MRWDLKILFQEPKLIVCNQIKLEHSVGVTVTKTKAFVLLEEFGNEVGLTVLRTTKFLVIIDIFGKCLRIFLVWQLWAFICPKHESVHDENVRISKAYQLWLVAFIQHYIFIFLKDVSTYMFTVYTLRANKAYINC